MNYARIYAEFISDRLTKQPSKPTYFERHHILPRCKGGGDEDDNIVRLVAEDHLFAHIVLARIYGGSLWHAVAAMTMQSHRRPGSDGYVRRSRKIYAKARIEAAAAHSVIMKGRFTGEDHPKWGVPCSELAKQKTRARHALGIHPMSSPEARKKVSDALKGRVFSKEHRAKISKAKMGIKQSEETCKKKSAAHMGKKLSVEHVRNLVLAQTGKKKSAQAVANMRAALTGRKLSPDHIQSLKVAASKRENKTPFLGGSHSDATKKRMSEVNQAKKTYANIYGVSPKYVSIAMMELAGISIGQMPEVANGGAGWQQKTSYQIELFAI